MHTRRPSRLKKFDYLGLHRYSLTYCTDWKRKWFVNPDDSNGKQFITKSKQCSAHDYTKKFKGRLWQPFAFEHVLRDDEKVHVVARYILENPVRAGLTKTVLDYPFLGSRVYNIKDLLDGLLVRS